MGRCCDSFEPPRDGITWEVNYEPLATFLSSYSRLTNREEYEVQESLCPWSWKVELFKLKQSYQNYIPKISWSYRLKSNVCAAMPSAGASAGSTRAEGSQYERLQAARIPGRSAQHCEVCRANPIEAVVSSAERNTCENRQRMHLSKHDSNPSSSPDMYCRETFSTRLYLQVVSFAES